MASKHSHRLRGPIEKNDMTDFFIIQYADTDKHTGLVATCQSEYYAKLIREILNNWKTENEYDEYEYKIEMSLESMYEHRKNLNREID